MFASFSEDALKAATIASEKCKQLNHYYVGVEHIFAGLLAVHDEVIDSAMKRCEQDPAIWVNRIEDKLDQSYQTTWGHKIIVTPRTERVIKLSRRISSWSRSANVRPPHLFLAILVENESVPARMLREHGCDIDGLSEDVITWVEEERTRSVEDGLDAESKVIGRFGRDLTREAKRGMLSPVFGRQAEVLKLAEILLRRTKNNPLIVGEAGVGKTSLVHGLAQWLLTEDAPPALRGKRIIELSMSSLVAGTMYRGEFEKRLEGIISEASRPGSQIVLFFDEIHTLIGAGAAGNATLDAAGILKPVLSSGAINCIGATTAHHYHVSIETDEALARRFDVVHLSEPSVEETVRILRGIRPDLERHHGLKISNEAILTAAKLADRYIIDRHFPDKAIDLLDRGCSQVVMSRPAEAETDGQPEDRMVVDARSVVKVAGQRIGADIPHEHLSKGDTELLENLKDRIGSRVLGQDKAISAVVRTVRSHWAGLGDVNRPIGVFLFVGPTGVGKTELAKALAASLLGTEKKLLRFDMSEYKEPHTISRLLGAPPGYVGYYEEGLLTKAVRENPYSVLLLDEIEKAHPDILKVFLQIFDAARVTDARGTQVSFSHTIIIMTSNLGASKMAASVGFAGESRDAYRKQQKQMNAQVKKAISDHFSLEFLNRIDEVVFFNYLTESALLKGIISKNLDELRQYLNERSIQLEVDDSVLDFLAEKGFSHVFGARELKRTIDRMIKERIASGILDLTFVAGDVITARIGDSGEIELGKAF